MDDWKVIRRETKTGTDWTVRSLRLPKDLDDYCNQQGNASDFIRELIKQHKATQGIIGLPDVEDHIRAAVERFYIKQGKWAKENFESGEIYPSPEKITDEQLQQLIDAVLDDYVLVAESTLAEKGSKIPKAIEAFQAMQLAKKCKNDRELWMKLYTKIYDWNWQMYLKYEK